MDILYSAYTTRGLLMTSYNGIKNDINSLAFKTESKRKEVSNKIKS